MAALFVIRTILVVEVQCEREARSRFFWIQLRPREDYEGKRVADEQYRNIKGRNVDTGAEESRVWNLRDALEVGVQQIGRPHQIEDPDDRKGESPAPGECRHRKKRQDCRYEVAPSDLTTEPGGKLGRHESNHHKVHSFKPKRTQGGKDSQRVVSRHRTKHWPDIEPRHDGTGDEGAENAQNEGKIKIRGHLGNPLLAFRLLSRLPRLQASKEVDHRGADLWRAFLLGPMSATRQHDRRPEFWDQCRLLRDLLGENGGDEIAVARHVKRRNDHRRASEGSQQLPAAIDVAPPGKRSMESTPREFRDVNIDVGLGDPGRQGRWLGQESTLPGHHPGSEPSTRGRRPVAREREELGTEHATDVAPKPYLSPRCLKA